jgi:hypothetical protein
MAPVAAALPTSPLQVVEPILTTSPTAAAAKDKQETIRRKRFEAVYTVIRDHFLADFRKHNMPEEAIEYYQKVRASSTSDYLTHVVLRAPTRTTPTDHGLQLECLR